jgi:hypothetical protein
MLYRAQGRYGEAEPLAVRAVQGLERVLGPSHPQTLASKNLLAEIRAALAKKDQAAVS